ncbi:hypothetical protein MJN76_28810, partial [Salmonella enterica subsp. enterica serovar Anatum]|nr:hypothetical protein [Salmonella enterica subsp. enterica serovar Anatum]
MVGNWAQSILHGGVIASALDVAAGLVCVGSTLTRHETISEDEHVVPQINNNMFVDTIQSLSDELARRGYHILLCVAGYTEQTEAE